MTEATLYYFHDPMCSWCWGFSPAWKKLKDKLPKDIEVRMLLGGLAPDSDEPMPKQMQQYLQQTWRAIEQRIPGTEFNYRFWVDCRPRRSTYPACRAVIAARLQGGGYEEPMNSGIQRAYYLEAKNPSDQDTLVAIAAQIGLDVDRFSEDLTSLSTQRMLEEDMRFAQAHGVQGFPSLMLVGKAGATSIPVNPLDEDQMLQGVLAATSD